LEQKRSDDEQASRENGDRGQYELDYVSDRGSGPTFPKGFAHSCSRARPMV
jgi:hypothetical protein